MRFTNMSGGGYAVHPIDMPDGEGDLHVTASGEMYVTRAVNGELWYFPNWSSLPSAPSQTIPGSWLLKLSVGANGRIFLSDQQNNRIYEMTNPTATPSIVVDATTLTSPADLSSPKGVYYDQGGNRLVICDSDHDTVDTFDLTTNTYTNGGWAISQPIDVCLGADGQWYFTFVTGVSKVSSVDTGAGYQSYGTIGSAQGEFLEPWSIFAYSP
ncbi:MAG: hypothetical protein KF812_02715 [Fimbriimonadaceae bacterium]|nr:hypothetical protein [Fimbriimonadaceae bacterium]